MELRTKRQIDELKIKKDVPLFICDADEVILYFAKHFKAFLNKCGWDLNLSGYRLDNAIFHKKEGHLAEKKTAQGLVERFIREETINQKATSLAQETLDKISKMATVVILTNVPDFAHKCRKKNFTALGMNYPVISNSGPKGVAIRYMTQKISRPCFFVDDSAFQIESASKENSKLISIHFSACNIVRNILPKSHYATYAPQEWSEVLEIVKSELVAFQKNYF